MRRILIPMVILSAAIAACGSNNAATQTAGGGGGGGQPTTAGEPTQNVTPTEASGGGGGGGGGNPAGWDQYGKVHAEFGGPVSKSVDLGFVPAGSIFGGAQGSSLNFTIDGTNQILSILIGADNKVVISYGGTDFTMPAADCTTSNWNVGATSGSGSFDCTAALTIMASGASVQGGTLKGNFEAHA